MSVSDLCKRIIPCLDVKNGVTVKGIKFGNLREIGDPVELGLIYQEQGADELTFLDISASNEERATVVDLVRRVADNLSIPFTVGGGISSLDTVKRLLQNGADKVTVNTAAVARPQLIEEIAIACGSQCCVLAIDVRANGPHSWEVLVKGGKVATGMDAFTWAKESVERGAGEILLTSWDKDGTLEGFDLELVKTFAQALSVPVIASGGARDPQSFIDVFTEGMADAALAASIFHDGTWTIGAVKEQLHKAGVTVRIC
ncbi:MAG: imidazole glycerol phosphate synthase subunit HisF [Candidatus Obscuribacterales bacterium]|nr:imidazole glycerol phosphate synthase subunit HisF [Candidatus Obscuribacterales bacterium]